MPADGTRGGILLAADENFFLLNEENLGHFSLIGKITMKEENCSWKITVVYGPQDDPEKICFLNELVNLSQGLNEPWLIIGDFNLIYKVAIKNNDRLDRRMMQRFKGAIDRLQIKELPLQGRKYTWAGNTATPT